MTKKKDVGFGDDKTYSERSEFGVVNETPYEFRPTRTNRAEGLWNGPVHRAQNENSRIPADAAIRCTAWDRL